MIFRRKLIILLSVVALGWSCTPAKDSGTGPLAVSSPDGSLTIALSLEAKPQPYAPGKRAYYRVSYKGAPVLADSPLGLDFQGAEPLERDFEVVTAADNLTVHLAPGGGAAVILTPAK